MSMDSIRVIDYYIKGLSFDVRQDIFKALDEIGEVTVKYLLRKNEGYPDYRDMGLSNEQILKQIEKAKMKFAKVNNIMIDNERNPIFQDSTDTYQSSIEYKELLKRRDEQELIEIFGCTWNEYIPQKYNNELNKIRE